MHYSGTKTIAVQYLFGFNTLYYRNSKLDSDGSSTWTPSDLTSELSGSSWEYSSALITNGKNIYS